MTTRPHTALAAAAIALAAAPCAGGVAPPPRPDQDRSLSTEDGPTPGALRWEEPLPGLSAASLDVLLGDRPLPAGAGEAPLDLVEVEGLAPLATDRAA